MRASRLAAFVALVTSAAAISHPAPNSLLRLEFRAADIRAEYWLPVSELAHARAAEPAEELPAYLLRHVAAETQAGARWRVTVDTVRETTYLDHPYFVATLILSPPPGAPARQFVLIDDAVTHEVRNHVVYVVENHADNALLGALQYPARRLAIGPR